MTGLRHLLLVALVCAGANGRAQTYTFPGALGAYSQTGRLSPRLDYNVFASLTFDALQETYDGKTYPSRTLQVYFQPSLIYKFNQNLNFAGSYTYQRGDPFDADFVNEHRLWEQVVMAHRAGAGRLTHRVRLEERFIENRKTEAYPLTWRLRYQLGFSIPLQGKTLDPKEWYFNCYNEWYFSLSEPRNALYSDNWTYAGVGYHTGTCGRLELGPLIQTSARDPAHDLKVLALAQLMWVTNFNPKPRHPRREE